MLTAAVALAARAADGQETVGWPSFQGGPSHPGTAETAPLEPALVQTWHVVSPKGSGLSGPAVGGDLGVATARTGVVGFDPGSGQRRWSAARAPGPLVPPALDLAAGEHGVVIYVEGNSRTTSGLVALDPSTRQRLWRVPLTDVVQGAPEIDGGTVFVSVRDGTVLGVDAASGVVAWRARLGSRLLASPAVAAGTVFAVGSIDASGKAKVSALNSETGHRLWTYTSPGIAAPTSSATVAGGRVYVGFGDFVARALDARTGRVVWSQPLRQDGDFSFRSAPVVAGGGLYLLDRRGRLYRLDPSTGDRVWDFQFAALSQSSSPVVSGRTVYLGLDDGTVAGVDTVTGHLRWEIRFRFGAVGALAPTGGLLLVSFEGPGGTIAALRHDANRALQDVHSPTELNVPRALGNFVVAFVAVTAGLMGFFRVVRPRPRPPAREVVDQEGDLEEDWSPEEEGAGEWLPEDEGDDEVEGEEEEGDWEDGDEGDWQDDDAGEGSPDPGEEGHS